jgi:hypothetical protein
MTGQIVYKTKDSCLTLAGDLNGYNDWYINGKPKELLSE